MFAQSGDGRISWSDLRVIATFNGINLGSNFVQGTAEGRAIAWIIGPGNPYRVLSVDGGASFYMSTQTIPASAITSDLTYWSFAENASVVNISRSQDFGATWSIFFSLPQPVGINEISLEGATYDSKSGNYSFLVSDKGLYNVRFITCNHDGSNYTFIDNITEALNPSLGAPHGIVNNRNYLKLECQPAAIGNTQWMILTNNYLVNNASDMQTLACCIKEGPGNFSSWTPFTAINGETSW